MIITKQQCIAESRKLAKPLGLKVVLGKVGDSHKYYLKGKDYKIGFYTYSMLYENLLSGYIESTLNPQHISNNI